MNDIIDRKFRILAVNPINGHIYTEKNALLLCAKDKAVPAALQEYHNKCERIGANQEHLESVRLLSGRVGEFQTANGSRVPDTIGAEIDRCIKGKGLEGQIDLGVSDNLKNAREMMSYHLKHDEGLRIAYVANVAMLLHDRYGIKDYEQRNRAANEILDLIFGE